MQKENEVQKEHASFIHEAIQQILTETGIALNRVDAISVTHGPGSYTGLRVGMATAKGICYALQKPLITINTLEVMARAAATLQGDQFAGNSILCPMIDARRMEVFMALYSLYLDIILPPCAMILDVHSLDEWLNNYSIYLFGSGSEKVKNLLHNKAVIFLDVRHSASDLAMLAQVNFNKKLFANLAYAEPLYIKEFYFK